MGQMPPIDIAGIGFGPSNLGLAIAIEEYNVTVGEADALRAHFFERKERFGWHPGMLLPDTTMQVSFLKELVTQRNASSSYGFLNYLADRGRLADFINRGDFFPLRAEFHDYLSWAAARVRVPVDYATEIDTVTWRAGVFELHTPDRASSVRETWCSAVDYGPSCRPV